MELFVNLAKLICDIIIAILWIKLILLFMRHL